MMKYKIIWISLICIVSVGLLLADSIVKKFALDPGYNKVTINWETGVESQIKGYEVQRGYNENQFRKLSYLEAKKSGDPINKYSYDDMSVFKSSSGASTYFYRLKIMKDDGSSEYSKVEKVIPTVSSARRTWGSLKAMFR